jgi:hypothetical protein
MKIRLPMLAVVTALVIGVSGTAYAFDCIRVSASAQGLAASVKSGNWLPFFLGSPAEVKQTLADNFGATMTDAQAACVYADYAASGQPKYFALGIGVAGGKKTTTTTNGARAGFFGVIAWHNKVTRVLSDGHGIDHFDDSPISGVLIGSLVDCGVPVPN